jgi:hypothetical protein
MLIEDNDVCVGFGKMDGETGETITNTAKKDKGDTAMVGVETAK